MKHLALITALALSSIATLAACSDGATATADAPRVEIGNAYIRPPLAGRDVAAGYFDATALGADATLVGASSDIASRVELHTHTMEGGAMRMRQVDSVPLPQGETVNFAPGGYHLMMFGVSLDGATDANVTLVYADGTDVTLTVPVGEPD